MTVRRQAIHASDIRSLGGTVRVVPVRDQDGRQRFRINHISGGRDLVWLSARLMDENTATKAAEVLAEFVGGRVLT